MDPITAMFLGALVLTACARVGIAATSDAIMTARASKDGQWDFLDRDRERRAAARQAWAKAWVERRAARNRAAGGSGEFRPGAREYTRDLYHGFWEDRLDRRTKKREARPEYVYDPGRPSLAQRFDNAVLARVERIRQSRGWTTVRDAARGSKGPVADLEPAPALAVDTGDVPVGTVRHTGGGRERWDGNEWKPVREPAYHPPRVGDRRTDDRPAKTAATPTRTTTSGGPVTASTRQVTCSCCQKPSWDADPAEYAPLCGLCRTRMNPSCVGCQHRGAADNQQAMRHTWSQPTATGTTINGGTMADIGLEASNYETAVPALDTLTAAARDLSEHVAGAKTAAAQFHDQVEEIDEARRAVEQAATSVAEQLSARNLDTATMSAITTSMEMVQTGDLAGAMDHIDAAIRLLAGAEAAAAEASGASAEASRTVVSKYGDAHAQVVSELSGDPSFLGSGGGAGAVVGGSGPSGNIRAHAGAGETVNVSGDSVGRTNRGGAAPSGRPSPGGGDGGSSHNVGVVQSGGGRVTVGGDTAGVINKG